MVSASNAEDEFLELEKLSKFDRLFRDESMAAESKIGELWGDI